MLLTLCVGIAVLFFGCTAVRGPSGILEYCKRISGTNDFYSSEMKMCMDQEKIAEKKLSGMAIPWQVESYCRHISEQTGGSYQVMLTCVEQEMQE
jgi:hypothetical protein